MFATSPHRQSRRDRPADHPRLPRTRHRDGLRLLRGRRGGPWLRFADEAICIGGGPASDSYLRIDRIISAAEISNVDAIHPGYGFLAENAHFAEVCRDCRIEFIGPSPGGDGRSSATRSPCKSPCASRRALPTFPGTEEAIEDPEEAVQVAARDRLPGDREGGRGRRRPRHAHRAQRGAAARRARDCPAGGGGGVRQRCGLRREVPRAGAARRDPGARRQARQRDPSLRARLHDASGAIRS